MAPKVSIIIAVRNEAKNLPKVLPTLVKQHYPVKEFEIIFADGKSKDRTREIIKEWQEKSPVKIILLDNPKKDSGSGRNIGIRKAKGKYIAQLSGHTIVSPDLLKVLVSKLEKQPPNVAGVGCRHKDPPDSTSFQKTIGKLLYSKVGGVGTSQQQGDEEKFVNSLSFICYRKKALLDIGLNDTKFKVGQDAELNIRLKKKGYKLLYTPQTWVEQYKRATYRGLAKQMFRYGYARMRIIRKHHSEFRPIYLAPALLVLFFIIFSTFGNMILFGRQILLAGFVIYSAPLIYTCVKLSKDSNEGVVMFPAFVIVHFSYGLGFLWGVLF